MIHLNLSLQQGFYIMNKSQSSPQNANPGHVAHRLLDIMKDFRVAMLVTQETGPSWTEPNNTGRQGQLRARPMAIADIGSTNDICFSTSMNTAKIEEIRKHPDVLVTMQSDSRYVSIGGRCELTQDRAEIAQLWNESWRIWFPKGKEDPELVLIRVPVETGEFWDLQGAKGVRFLWEAAKAYFSGDNVEPVPNSHGTLPERSAGA
jgi:general stress protein 26